MKNATEFLQERDDGHREEIAECSSTVSGIKYKVYKNGMIVMVFLAGTKIELDD